MTSENSELFFFKGNKMKDFLDVQSHEHQWPKPYMFLLFLIFELDLLKESIFYNWENEDYRCNSFVLVK